MESDNALINKTLKSETNNSVLKTDQDREYYQLAEDNLEAIPQSSFQSEVKQQRRTCVSPTTKRVAFQIFIFSLTFMNYAVLHATRAAWSNATPDLKLSYDFSTQLVSAMNAVFLSFYAAGGVYSGHLADKFNKKWFILITYSLIGLVVIVIGTQQYFEEQQVWLYFILKIINGLIQSVGWATNLAILSNWFPRRGRGLLIGCWACNASVGDIIGTQVYKVTSTSMNEWGTCSIITGGLVIIMGIINALFLVEYPKEKGIVILEKGHLLEKQEEHEKHQNILEGIENVDAPEVRSISFKQALLIPGVVIFAISFMFIKFSMYGLFYWLPTYLRDQLNFSKADAANMFSTFDAGSIVGNILMGLITDLLPYRSPVFEVGIVLSTIFTLALTFWDNTSKEVLSIIMFFLGFTLTGSSIVIAAIECDLGKQEILKHNQKALATVSGIIDGVAGFGSILGQILIGVIKDSAGWRATFLMLTIVTGLSGVPAFFFMRNELKEWRKKRRQSKLKAIEERLKSSDQLLQ